MGGGACCHQCFVFEQDILIPVELVSTQEAAAPSCHGYRVVNWDVYSQHKQTNKYLYSYCCISHFSDSMK